VAWVLDAFTHGCRAMRCSAQRYRLTGGGHVPHASDGDDGAEGPQEVAAQGSI